MNKEELKEKVLKFLEEFEESISSLTENRQSIKRIQMLESMYVGRLANEKQKSKTLSNAEPKNNSCVTQMAVPEYNFPTPFKVPQPAVLRRKCKNCYVTQMGMPEYNFPTASRVPQPAELRRKSTNSCVTQMAMPAFEVPQPAEWKNAGVTQMAMPENNFPPAFEVPQPEYFIMCTPNEENNSMTLSTAELQDISGVPQTATSEYTSSTAPKVSPKNEF
ncbi:uncharacterized protein LOC129907868 [Episyrphus balteatus]|uniref:uncharacterized protein LOC129907868 n=1 Tax=Episyrphus balteatus TaxID=286459 RepID=UPI0024854AEB|nr:uncharacterized protein LOC129907868 [Episyrphus balteatus]